MLFSTNNPGRKASGDRFMNIISMKEDFFFCDQPLCEQRKTKSLGAKRCLTGLILLGGFEDVQEISYSTLCVGNAGESLSYFSILFDNNFFLHY